MKKLYFLLLLGAVANAFSATLLPIQLLNPAGSTSGQAIVSTGSSTAPAWGGIAVNGISAIAANTVIANATASSASPTAVAIPSCSTSTSALQYTSGTGFSCYTSSATTTGTLAQFAATTSAQLAGVISDETGSGSLVFGTSPTISGLTTTGTLSAATITASGTITPSQTSGIVGTTTNNNANAGSVGEAIIATATGVAQTSTVISNVTSISLTAGDYDVTCSWTGTGSGGTSAINFGLTTTTGAQAPVGQRVLFGGFSTTAGIEMACPTFRLSLASSATLFLTSAPTFTGTMTVGGTIWARRRR
jgi:hypothetical protein